MHGIELINLLRNTWTVSPKYYEVKVQQEINNLDWNTYKKAHNSVRHLQKHYKGDKKILLKRHKFWVKQFPDKDPREFPPLEPEPVSSE